MKSRLALALAALIFMPFAAQAADPSVDFVAAKIAADYAAARPAVEDDLKLNTPWKCRNLSAEGLRPWNIYRKGYHILTIGKSLLTPDTYEMAALLEKNVFYTTAFGDYDLAFERILNAKITDDGLYFHISHSGKSGITRVGDNGQLLTAYGYLKPDPQDPTKNVLGSISAYGVCRK